MKTDIYTLAHEIKNPLSVVKGYLEMLNKVNLDKYKEVMKEEIDVSLEILNEYLEYSRIVLNKECIDLNILLLDIKKNMKDFLKKKGVHLDFAPLAQSMRMIYGSFGRSLRRH